MKRAPRSLSRYGLLALAAAIVVGPALGTDVAHAETLAALSTSPADGTTVAASPAQVTITFNQTIGSAASVVIACNGTTVNQPEARVGEDISSLIVDLTSSPLPKGQCEVLWQAQGTTEPGTQRGNFSFTVEQDTVITVAPVDSSGTPISAPAATPGSTTTDEAASPPNVGGPLGLARLLSSLSVAVLFGALVLITVAWPEGIEYILTIRFLRYTWALAVFSTVLLVICLTAQANGDSIGSSISPTGWVDLKDTTPGIAALARVVLVIVAGWVAMRPERCIDPTTQLPALAIPGLAVATMGFTRSGGDLELVGFAAGVVHAIAMAVWLGGLVLLARVVLAGPGEDDLVHAVRGFGRRATPALLATVVSGGVQVYRLDNNHLFDTTHGRLLLLKVVPVIAMVFVGVATRQFIRSRLGRADVMTAPMAGRLRRAIGMEAVIGVLVLAVTAWMLSTVPGNLRAAPRSSDDFAYQRDFRDPDDTVDVKLSVHPAKVGMNELFLEVTRPETGINSITVTFAPPAGVAVNTVVLTLQSLTGAGAAYAPKAEGLKLEAPGAWSVTVIIDSASGIQRQTDFLPVEDDASGDIPAITTVPSSGVTSPPATSTSTTSTTVAG